MMPIFPPAWARGGVRRSERPATPIWSGVRRAAGRPRAWPETASVSTSDAPENTGCFVGLGRGVPRWASALAATMVGVSRGSAEVSSATEYMSAGM